MEKKREVFDFASEVASPRPQLIRRATARWPEEFWRGQSPELYRLMRKAMEALQRRLAKHHASHT